MNKSTENRIITVTPQDNVGIVVNGEGIKAGTHIDSMGIDALEDIPMGHKLALVHLALGDPIVRYGCVIGYASRDIFAGQWVNETNIDLPMPPPLDQIKYEGCKSSTTIPLEGFTFMGYKNKDGSVGTKNILAISTSVQCVAGFTEHVVNKVKVQLLPQYPNVDDVVALKHSYGCGVAIEATAADIPIRTIQNIALNPNFGGEALVIGLGCEKLRPERVAQDQVASIMYMQDTQYHGFEKMVEGAMHLAKMHLERLNKRVRTSCPISDLVIGMQCGGSDAFSGITANPVAGFASDLIVRSGGTVIFSEVTEVRDAIKTLVDRTSDDKVAAALISEMKWYDHYLNQGNVDRSANTTPGNKKGGLSNIVEKALGSVSKSGSMPIVDVIGPGEKIKKKGLVFAATPAGDFVCGTLQLAAGMNVHVFMTGRGTPYGLAMVPVIKVGSNSTLSNRWYDLIDIDTGVVATGHKTIEQMGWELFHLIIDVASGRRTVASDLLGLYNDLVLFNPGPLT